MARAKSVFEKVPHEKPPEEKGRPFRIRSRPTLELVARALIVNHMDYEKAVVMLFPNRSTEFYADTLDYLEAHTDLQAEVENQLKITGLDETSKEAYVKQMWMWMWGVDNELKTTAARILGKAFMPEKVDDQPKPLRIAGIEDGLAKMGLGAVQSQPKEELEN